MCYKYLNRLSICIILFCCLSISASAADEKNPLQPMDLSSPRATLKSFLDAGDAGFQQMAKILQGAHSRAELKKQSVLGRKAKTALDLSEIPPAVVFDVSRDGMFYLYDVLSRIELPAAADIPDKTAYAETGSDSKTSKEWKLNNVYNNAGFLFVFKACKQAYSHSTQLIA